MVGRMSNAIFKLISLLFLHCIAMHNGNRQPIADYQIHIKWVWKLFNSISGYLRFNSFEIYLPLIGSELMFNELYMNGYV